MKRILTFLAAIVCICSCEKEKPQGHWLFHTWGGIYETTVINNDTGESRPVEAFIDLRFSEDRTQCTMTRGYNDEMLAVAVKTYWVDLSSDKLYIALRVAPGDSEIIYRGTFSQGYMILTWGEGTEERTATLIAHKVE